MADRTGKKDPADFAAGFGRRLNLPPESADHVRAAIGYVEKRWPEQAACEDSLFRGVRWVIEKEILSPGLRADVATREGADTQLVKDTQPMAAQHKAETPPDFVECWAGVGVAPVLFYVPVSEIVLIHGGYGSWAAVHTAEGETHELTSNGRRKLAALGCVGLGTREGAGLSEVEERPPNER